LPYEEVKAARRRRKMPEKPVKFGEKSGKRGGKFFSDFSNFFFATAR
jgi:hypothetical protein